MPRRNLSAAARRRAGGSRRREPGPERARTAPSCGMCHHRPAVPGGDVCQACLAVMANGGTWPGDEL